MKHIANEDWIDFVNHTLTSGRREELQHHLESGCARCAATMAFWKRVRTTGVAERTYQPPEGAVRALKAAFEASGRSVRRKRAASAVQMLFDSFLEPALVGTRSAGTRMRQILYRAAPYQIDVQIEGTPSGRRLLVTGQVIDVTHAQTAGREIPIVLSNGRGNVVRTVTNEHGEFEGVVEDSGDLELSFVGTDYRPTVITLRDALGRGSGGAR